MRRFGLIAASTMLVGIGMLADPNARHAWGQSDHQHGPVALALQPNVTVTIVDFAFNPGSITITAGGTITWRNTGQAPHTATADNRSFDSRVLNAGGTFSFKFDTPGTIPYHCDVHPNMTGTIAVQAAPQPTPSPAQATAARTPTPAPPTTTVTPTQAATAGAPNVVRIVDFDFEPGSRTIAPGTTVTWMHAGNAPHTVTSTGAVRFDSGRLANGQTFSFKFDAAGTYEYRCEVHPARMSGTIIVQGAATAPPSAGSEPRGATGVAVFGDAQGRSDQVRIEAQGLQAQGGTTIIAWLSSASGDFLNLGELKSDAQGKATLTYNDGQRRNLLGLYDRITVTAETGTPGARPAGRELMRDEVPQAAMVHIRHLLARFEETPNNTPLATGLLAQAALAADHANLAKLAVQANDLAVARLHLEHVVNIIEGDKGPNFGDLNGDEKRDNPGDGFGLLTYAKAAAEHAAFAADAAPRDETVNLHAGHVKVATQNATQWATQARDLALPLFKAPTIAAIRGPVDQIKDLLEAALEGRDVNRDGRIDPVPGEGAARTAYNHAQLMAMLEPTAAQAAGQVVPPAAPAAVPTQAAPVATQQAAPAPAGVNQSASGTRLVVIAVLAAALLVLVLGLGAWLFTGRKGPGTTATD